MKKYLPHQHTLLAAVFSMAAFNASAAWTINGSYCQTYSDDGGSIVRVKPDNIGLIEMQARCNGRGSFDLTGSNFGVGGIRYPSSAMCNAQTQYHTIQFTPTTKDIRSIINTMTDSKQVTFNTFGTAFNVNTADFAQACSSIINQKVADFDPQKTYQQDMTKMGYKQDENGQWHKQSKQAFSREADPEIAANYNPSAGRDTSLTGKGGFYGDGASKNLYEPGSQAQKDATAANEARRLAAQQRGSKSTPGTTEPEIQTAQQSAYFPVNAFCTLDNGKNVGVYAAAGQDYRYTYTDKSDKPELELAEGQFGVKAFHYHVPLGMGSASYIRFNKGIYDYILLSKDTGHEEFQGIRVYKNGDLISAHECKTRLKLDTRVLPQDSHVDNEKMGEHFTLN
ncbi:hypothetical protein [Enterobacter sp. CC120223-11]|uniref:hypothetical protein n=1 Tax=Enterobacter sp. CC120223-11 TaxID=1378073 RepID=UPI000BCFE434|nr:hypothetical protein [Enterobacter sp. CC120223-11]SNY61270.1 hypothetical protein SAMN02744775_00528 [Enterobacter sp. CC120223-11]